MTGPRALGGSHGAPHASCPSKMGTRARKGHLGAPAGRDPPYVWLKGLTERREDCSARRAHPPESNHRPVQKARLRKVRRDLGAIFESCGRQAGVRRSAEGLARPTNFFVPTARLAALCTPRVPVGTDAVQCCRRAPGETLRVNPGTSALRRAGPTFAQVAAQPRSGANTAATLLALIHIWLEPKCLTFACWQCVRCTLQTYA